MPTSTAMRQIGAKNVGFKIELMKWSNRMDLLAFSNDKGEVIVQRLSWQKIVTHPPPSDGLKVRGLDWRPDEKIIAIAYNNGKIVLFDIESQQDIHTFNLSVDITYLGWTQKQEDHTINADDDVEHCLKSHETYLPTLPSLSSLSLTPRRSDYSITKSYSKNILNLLLIGLKNGKLHTSIFGVLPVGTIDIGQHINRPASDFYIIDARMSLTFQQTFVLIRSKDTVKLLCFDNGIISKYSVPLLNLAAQHGHILNTLAYIDDIIQSMTEAWETALLEMDNKLAKYASTQPPGTLAADFLELLMFGYASDSLMLLLTRDFTEKELKRLGNSIEISYSTIQKLVIKPLHNGILSICYHLNCLKGMEQNSYYYKPLLEKISNKAIKNAGAFLIKSLELQLSIDQSTRDYKIFWSWLYSVIIRLMEESVPDEIAAVSQQDLMYLAEFLNNFDPIDGEPVQRKKFNLEQVGQYLENKNLHILCNVDLTHKWDKLLSENDCLQNSDLIYPHHKELSLVQEYNQLKQSITELFEKSEQLIGKDFKLTVTVDLLDVLPSSNENVPKLFYTSFINNEAENLNQFCGLIGNDNSHSMFFYIEVNSGEGQEISAIKLEFRQKPFSMEKLDEFSFRHIQFYNKDTISMLLNKMIENRITNCFIQFPIAWLRSRLQSFMMQDIVNVIQDVAVTNIYEIIDAALIRNLDGFDGHKLCVSGSRKVAALLSESQKRVRLYEMETEDDDEEFDMSQNNSLDISRESNKQINL